MPLPVNAQPIPITYREVQDHCGPAVVRAIIRYRLGRDVPELELVEQLKPTPEEGTAPDSIIRVLGHDYGLPTRLVERASLEDLRSVLERGASAILNLQAWAEPTTGEVAWQDRWDDGHYVVLVGLDETHLYVMDPSIGHAYGYLPLNEFEVRWHDQRLLEDGTERRYLQSFFQITGGNPQALSTPTQVVVAIE
ncbi:C39 family peptidase [Candidatus Berkelbacteria bacterium]|nr:C39 family peptidase [Candidatus Berkelbacteria bacterium]